MTVCHTGERTTSDPEHPGATQVLRISPPLSAREVTVIVGLAGVGPLLHMWPGQPRSRSPWLVCAAGCCLVRDPARTHDAVVWLRLLVRELISPRSRAALDRVAGYGLPGGHRVTGRVSVGDLAVAVGGGQVRVSQLPTEADDVPDQEPRRRNQSDDAAPSDDGDR